MPYKAPVRDYQFLYADVFKTDQYNNLKGFEDATTDMIAQILE